MKRLTFLLISLAFFAFRQTNAQDSCLPGGLTFSTQSQIDSFPVNYPGCTIIEGDVIIQEELEGAIISLDSLYLINTIEGDFHIGIFQYPPQPVGNDSLLNLSGLQGLTFIGGSLSIVGNESLISLNGLGSINSIGESLHIGTHHQSTFYITPFGNPSLTSLNGLDSLTSIGGSLKIEGNDSLTSLSGLDSLSSIGGGILVKNNVSLTGINALHNIDTLSGALCIQDNENLVSLTGLGSLQYLGSSYVPDWWGYQFLIGLSLTGNSSLESLNGLGSLNYIEGPLEVFFNNSLTSLSGLENLTSIEGGLSISSNSSLTSLSGLENLITIGEDPSSGVLYVSSNPSLTSLSGLENINTIRGLRILNNEELTSLNGLENIESINSDGLRIEGNSLLTSLTALNSLTEISGSFRVEDTALQSFNGLENLGLIDGSIVIKYNDALTSLSGLDNIDHTAIDQIIIENNPNLSFCSVQSICDFILDAGLPTPMVWNNATGCFHPGQIVETCLSVRIEEFFSSTDGISIYPNPTHDILNIEGIDQGQWELRVVNTLGELIYSHVMTDGGIVDLSGLAPGLYFLELTNGIQSITKRIVKE